MIRYWNEAWKEIVKLGGHRSQVSLMPWHLHKQAKIQACKCLKVTKLKPKDNRSQRASKGLSYRQSIVFFFLNFFCFIFIKMFPQFPSAEWTALFKSTFAQIISKHISMPQFIFWESERGTQKEKRQYTVINSHFPHSQVLCQGVRRRVSLSPGHCSINLSC